MIHESNGQSERIKIVVWDNIGNTLLGVRSWEQWDEKTRERFLIEDPEGRSKIRSLPEILDGYDYEITWLHNPNRLQKGFTGVFQEYESSLKPVNSMDDVAEAIADADFLVMHKEKLPGEVLAQAKKLRLIQHLGREHEGVPLDCVRQMGIPFAATPLINYDAVAEHIWALILNHFKHLPDQRRYMTSRAYVNEWGAYHPGVKIISDLTLGQVGMGEIARPTARIGRAFGMRVIYTNRTRYPDLEAEYGMEWVEWDELFKQSDIVCIQLALNEHTIGIIGEREIGLMKPDALFVNTARGKLVDQAALTAALRDRTIGGAALDVYDPEPLPPDDPLHDLHEDPSYDVTLTPHSGAQGPWTWVRDSQNLWLNVARALKGEPVQYLVER